LHRRGRIDPMAAMDDHPILDRDRRQLPEPMSEEDLEDFLTEAIGFYAEQTETEVAELRTFAEAKLLLRNRGLVVGIGGAEFRISIVRS
jgi:hypothetical protein